MVLQITENNHALLAIKKEKNTESALRGATHYQLSTISDSLEKLPTSASDRFHQCSQIATTMYLLKFDSNLVHKMQQIRVICLADFDAVNNMETFGGFFGAVMFSPPEHSAQSEIGSLLQQLFLILN